MADENDIALGVMKIAVSQPNGIVTLARAKKEIPKVVNLSDQNVAISTTRPGEPMWYQLLRNIKSHHETDGNYIQLGYLKHIPRVGYQITLVGKNHIAATHN